MSRLSGARARLYLWFAWRRLVAVIVSRPLTQVGPGIGVAGVVVAVMAMKVSDGALSAKHAALLVACAALVLAACLLACVVPTRRALRIEPTDAARRIGETARVLSRDAARIAK